MWIFLYLVAVSLTHIVKANTSVDTNVGQILGVRATDGNYTSFMGIPFAEVDRNNPFGASTRYPKFDEPFEAYHESTICPQINEFQNVITGTLDCLQLNVYVPDAASLTNQVPVIVWIYGGAFDIGNANKFLYGPSYIVRHDVILVTINYRVGPYGFMCLDTPQVPGNQGLKDQLQGLRWVKENIEFFGGNPDQITLFGQSAGSMSIHFHLLSPQEELFHRVIMHSGSAFTADIIRDVDRTIPMKLAEKLGFLTTDMDEALRFLATQNSDSVVQANTEIDSEFWLCVESNHEGVETLITDFPINLNVPKIQGKSVLLGFTEDEWIMVYANMARERFQDITIFHDFLKDYFTFDKDRLHNIQNIVENFYLGGQSLSQEMMHEITNFHSDILFNHPIYRCIPSFLNNGADQLFLFKFSYMGERNFIRNLHNISVGGAAHSDELGYLFDMEYLPEEPTPEDQLMIDRMTLMWTNFAKYGDPTPETTSLVPVKWEPIKQGDTVNKYLNIDSELTTGVNPFHERMSLWNLLYEGFAEYQKGYRRNHASLRTISNSYLILVIMYLFT